MAAGEVTVHVEQEAGEQQSCPHCGAVSAGYDQHSLSWRHLDTCQFKTMVVAEVSRVGCPHHGMVTDQPRRHVLYVADERKAQQCGQLLGQPHGDAQSGAGEHCDGYVARRDQDTLAQIPEAQSKIAFDKFHVATYLGNAVDQVRKQEHKGLMKEGWDDLKGPKYALGHQPAKLHAQTAVCVHGVESQHAAHGTCLGDQDADHAALYTSRTWVENGWRQWYAWAIRSRLAPIKKVAQIIKEYLWDILNAVLLQASNGASESMNSRIQGIKIRRRGFRNKARYIQAIYFYFGGLDLSPEGVRR